MDPNPYDAWLGRTETVSDFATASPLRRLAALFDHEGLPWPAAALPPLGHWLFHLPDARQSTIGRDGHPRPGGFLPALPLPRRMWAGSRIRFFAPIALEQTIERTSTILTIAEKSARSGSLIFVTVQHDIIADGEIRISEQQDLVYRGDADGTPPAALPPPQPWQMDGGASPIRRAVADSAMLLRFSALTYNAHRIHYDRDYARDVEGYPGLVVHGPLLAMSLMDHFLRAYPDAVVTDFSFRAKAPLFAGQPFDLHREGDRTGGKLWTIDRNGIETMSAEITAR